MYRRPLPARARLCVGLIALGLLAGVSCAGSPEQAASPVEPQRAAMPASLRAAYLQARQQEAGPEYLMQTRGAQVVADNTLHHLALVLDAQGVHLRHTEAVGQGSLRLDRAGCAERPESMPTVSPRAQGTQVQYVRAGLTEWYKNGPLGLEQGFTITRDSGCAQLALELQLGGDLTAELVGSGDLARVQLTDLKTGQVIFYSNLFAHDAAGQELPTRMTLSDHTIRLAVDATGAHYPIEVDPMLWAEQQKLNGSDGTAQDSFGFAVAVSGDTAVIGAYQKSVSGNKLQGQAYVYLRAGTTWTEQQKLVPSDGTAGDQFGTAVAVSGDTAVVGAYQKTVGAKAKQGQAYVYFRTGTTWAEQQKLIASDGAAADEFGVSVAVSGDTAVVGALQKTVAASVAQGQAYVYFRTGTTWAEQQKLTASDGAAMDNYGKEVAISGDTTVIGVPSKKVGNNVNQGQVYVYLRSGTVWSEQPKLTASDGISPDGFGSAVAISGNTAVVGAMNKQVGNNSSQGRAYVYLRTGTVWSEQQKLNASDGAALDDFGSAVAISGDTVVVGALGKTVNGQALQGQAYAYVRSGTTWMEQQKFIASDGAVLDQFGISVAISGDTVIVGAFQKAVNGHALQGQAYAFLRTLFPNGAQCMYETDCISSFCVVGICCDSACGSGVCDTGHCRLFVDMSVTVNGTPTSGIDPTSFVIQVDDLGPNPADDVSVAITIPADAPLISTSGPGWTCTSQDTLVTCTLAPVAVGPQAPIQLILRAPYNDASITVSAQVSSSNPDPVPTNNRATATVQNDNPLSARLLGGGLGGCGVGGARVPQVPLMLALFGVGVLAFTRRRRAR